MWKYCFFLAEWFATLERLVFDWPKIDVVFERNSPILSPIPQKRAIRIPNCVGNFFLWLHCNKEWWIFGERINWSMANEELINVNWASSVSCFVRPWVEASLVWIAVFPTARFCTSLLVPFQKMLVGFWVITQFYVSKVKSSWLVTARNPNVVVNFHQMLRWRVQGEVVPKYTDEYNLSTSKFDNGRVVAHGLLPSPCFVNIFLFAAKALRAFTNFLSRLRSIFDPRELKILCQQCKKELKLSGWYSSEVFNTMIPLDKHQL